MPYSNCKLIALPDDYGNNNAVHGMEIGKIDCFLDEKTKKNISMNIYMGVGKFYASVTAHGLPSDENSTSRLVLSEKKIQKLCKVISRKYAHDDLPHMLAGVIKSSKSAVVKF